MAASITSTSGDTTSPGGTATVSVLADNTGSVKIRDIPNDWSVESSQNDGAFVTPDGMGDSIADNGVVTWAWASDQTSVDVSVTLRVPGDAAIQTNTLDVEVGAGDSGSDTATTTVRVEGQTPDPANFQVNVDGTNSPVTEGDTLTVGATITNTGGQGGSQTVTAELPGVGSDSSTVNLNAGSSTTFTFSIPTSSGDAGRYTATVSSQDSRDGSSVRVEEETEPANFQVRLDGTNSPVTEGDTLTVDATIQNTGGESDSQRVTAELPGVGSDSNTVNLNGGSSTTETFRIQTESGDAGDYTVSVNSQDSSDGSSVRVEEEAEPANFNIDIDNTNSPVTEGNALTVDATITNTGDQEDSQTVTAEIPGVGSDSETVSLSGGSSTTERLRISTQSGDGGSYTVSVSTDDDSDSTSVSVEEDANPASFDVNIDSTNSPVTEGDAPIAIAVTVTNTGEQDGTQTVIAEVPGVGSDSDSVSLSGGSSASETLEIPTSSGDEGSYSVSVSTDDDSTSTSVSVSADQQSGGDSDGSDGTGTDGGGTTGDDGSGSTPEGDGDDTAGGGGSDGTTGGDGDGSPTDGTEEPTGESDTNWLIYALGAVGLVGGGYGGYRMLNSDDKENEDGDEVRRTPSQRGSRDGRGAGGPPSVGSADEYPSGGSLTYDDIENVEPIGSGGNADVYRAVADTEGGKATVAVKEPRMSGTLHIEKAERIMQEAETWDQLDDHENIVSVVDYGSEPLPWIAMEYMDGGHMGEVTGELEPRQALWTAVSVTEGVENAHQKGIAHLDLKPENVLFRSRKDGWDVPKVADWGLSKHLLEHSKSIEGMSPQYAAPEQFDEEEFGKPDNITDVYQLGAVFYDLFTGRPPFEGKPTKVMRAVMDDEPAPPSEVADVPPELDEILMKALEKDKDDRYDNILYLRDDLRELRDSFR